MALTTLAKKTFLAPDLLGILESFYLKKIVNLHKELGRTGFSSAGIAPCDFPRSSLAIPPKTLFIPPLLLGLTESSNYNIIIL